MDEERHRDMGLKEGTMAETLGSDPISTKLDRIAKLAKQAPNMAFTTLAHHLDVKWLHEAYQRTRKDGALGVDGQSATEYAKNLDENLRSLLERAKSGSYKAPPVKRVHIPKGNGETRPLGIPTFEDKILQRAVTMVLEAIYEQDFLDCSYGFRPKRSAHQALDAFHDSATWMAGGWVIEIDIRKYFDSIDHKYLREVLSRRVRDGVIVRLIGKWLNAGVMEDGVFHQNEKGSPQGGVISPMLANIFLHEVFDTWFEREVRPRMQGKARLIRFADDAVILFGKEQDAKRVMEVLPKRFERYGLELHPQKTKLVAFKRPDRAARNVGSDDDEPLNPASFDFLGFTIHWGKSLAGKWVVRERTAKDRFRRALTRIWNWCKTNRHEKVAKQRETLNKKLRGHYAYYGRTGNRSRLWDYRQRVIAIWRRWLSCRSQRGRISWEKMVRLLQRNPLLKPSAMKRA